jgi:hypothetical protein
VDDVIEYANLASFTEQSTGKIYVARDTGKIYRWSGSAYVEISPSPGSTDSVTEGSTNLYHTNARAAAAAPVQSVAGRSGTVTLTKSDVGLGSVDNTADASKPVSTAMQTALDGKAATSHTHSLANLTQSSATTGQVPTWNGSAWAAATPSGGGGGGSVTIPASDPNYANTLLLSRFDSGFEDYGPLALSPTVSGSAAISNTQFKFGTRSAYFPSGSESTTNCVRYGSGSQFDICKADFTVEAWVYATAVNNYSGIISRDNQSDRRNWLLLLSYDGVKPLQFVAYNTSAATFVSVADTVAFPLNQWVHVAAVRDSGVLRLYKNGVQVASASMSSGTGTLSTASGPVTIGALNENGNYGFSGYIDEARVLSSCIYKNGTTFTPSLYPVPNYVPAQTISVVY